MSESIEDIVREMREKNPREEYPAEYGYGEVPNEMRKLADRIEAAAKKEREEIKHLRSALEPVLNIRIDALNRYGVNCESLFGSVILEAQRIYESEVEK